MSDLEPQEISAKVLLRFCPLNGRFSQRAVRAGAPPRSIVPAAPLHSRVISGPEERIDKNLVGPAMVRRSAGAVTRTPIPGSARSGFEYTRV